MTKNIRNIILVGHSASGKTSLSEALLATCHAIPRLGSVAQGTTVSDYNPDEIERLTNPNYLIDFVEDFNLSGV